MPCRERRPVSRLQRVSVGDNLRVVPSGRTSHKFLRRPLQPCSTTACHAKNWKISTIMRIRCSASFDSRPAPCAALFDPSVSCRLHLPQQGRGIIREVSQKYIAALFAHSCWPCCTSWRQGTISLVYTKSANQSLASLLHKLSEEP